MKIGDGGCLLSSLGHGMAMTQYILSTYMPKFKGRVRAYVGSGKLATGSRSLTILRIIHSNRIPIIS